MPFVYISHVILSKGERCDGHGTCDVHRGDGRTPRRRSYLHRLVRTIWNSSRLLHFVDEGLSLVFIPVASLDDARNSYCTILGWCNTNCVHHHALRRRKKMAQSPLATTPPVASILAASDSTQRDFPNVVEAGGGPLTQERLAEILSSSVARPPPVVASNSMSPSFLIVGHTNEDIDQVFSVLSRLSACSRRIGKAVRASTLRV